MERGKQAATWRESEEAAGEEQQQLHEDIQAELGEAVKCSTCLEDQCCSLEDQLVKVMEESKLEQLRAIDAICSKYEKFLQQV